MYTMVRVLTIRQILAEIDGTRTVRRLDFDMQRIFAWPLDTQLSYLSDLVVLA